MSRTLPLFLLLLGPLLPGPLRAQKRVPRRYAIVGGKVLPMEGPVLEHGVILTRGTKIENIGPAKELSVPPGYKIIDATGRIVMPGFVELHNHSGGSDLQSRIYQVNPGSQVVDNIDLDTPALRFAVSGGVTTLLTIPGSANNMSGWGVARKTWGHSRKSVIIRFPGALKIAQAGNPERRSGELGSGRMGMNWLIRHVMFEGKAYADAWQRYEQGQTKVKPRKIVRLELMRGLFKKEYPIVVHTQWFSVVQMTMRILHDELGLDVVVDHGTFDGYLNAPPIARRGIPVALGPRQFLYDRSQGRIIGLTAAWLAMGLSKDAVALNTDAPVVPEEELSYQASMAVRMGLPEEVALAGLTVNGARMLKIDNRVGSLKAGKDADIVIWNGSPLDPRNRAVLVLINGEVAYDSARDGIRW